MEDGGPSVTARRVAAHRLGFARVATDYGDPAADEALAADVAAGRAAPANRMHDYLAARTSFFDRTVVSALGRGVRQVVVGAAGYDGRAFRYAKPGVRWFEVDHPATQRDKLERLERLGIDASHVRFVEADFTRDPVADRLRAAGLDPDAPSLFLLEGVAVYLEPAVLEDVLGQFRQVAAPGSRLAISVSLSRPRGDAARARFQATVAALGEPARSTFEAAEAEALLARTGWRLAAGARATASRQPPGATASARPACSWPAPPTRAAPAPAPRASSRASTAPATRARAVPATPGAQRSLPLSALLSQALVAFTIEFDNEAEHRLPHRTTSHGSSGPGDGDPAPWLVSLAMWENCMRYVTGEPITVGDLEARARTGTNLDGMRRWGYITIDGTARKVHNGRPGPGAVLRATAAGLRAREIWRPLPGLHRAALARALRRGSAQPPARSPHQHGQPARSGAARLPADPRRGPAQPGTGSRAPAQARRHRAGGAAAVGPAVPGPAVVRRRVRARSRAVPGGRRQRAARAGHRRDPAARPPRPDRHLQGVGPLGAGHPDPG